MFIILLYLLSINWANAQNFKIDGNQKRVTIHFSFIRNLIVLHLNINDKGPFNFVLDTGVGVMIITDPGIVDLKNIPNKHTIRINGMGGMEGFDAYLVKSLNVNMPGIIGERVSAAILKKDEFGLSNYAGIPIQGLLGYEFFESFAVHINFADSTITVGVPKNIRVFRKATKVPLSIEEHRPYINTPIKLHGEKEVASKLIVDLGAGHSLSLENLLYKNFNPAQKFITANLGISITGPINGYLSRVDEIAVGDYKLKNIITSFPEYNEEKANLISVTRDGNLGIDILKKFNLIIDYQNSVMYLKPNIYFKQQFEHDMSGLEYYADGADLKRIIISRVETGSAADDIGIQKGDEIISINFKPVLNMTIEEIDGIFRSRNDRSVLLQIYRSKQAEKVILTLKQRI